MARVQLAFVDIDLAELTGPPRKADTAEIKEARLAGAMPTRRGSAFIYVLVTHRCWQVLLIAARCDRHAEKITRATHGPCNAAPTTRDPLVTQRCTRLVGIFAGRLCHTADREYLQALRTTSNIMAADNSVQHPIAVRAVGCC